MLCFVEYIKIISGMKTLTGLVYQNHVLIEVSQANRTIVFSVFLTCHTNSCCSTIWYDLYV